MYELNQLSVKRCRKHWNNIAKPLYSLGKLEDYIIQIAGICDTEKIDLAKKAVIVFCADNGVVCEGVTQSGKEVTAIVAESIANGTANINAIARTVNANVFPVDMGIDSDISNPKIINRKIAHGTKNISKEPAMTKKQAEDAIQAGIDLAGDFRKLGYKILATGEMGIGNTTTSSAVSAVLLGLSPETVTGRGAGLPNDRLEHKISVIRKAIEINSPDRSDALDVLSKLGGFDIAGMAGMFIGGAVHRIPVVIDGFISSVSALIAVKLCPDVRNFIIPSHTSNEPAGKLIMQALGFSPVIDGNLSLGEGTGAVMMFSLLDSALAVYNQNTTFENISIEPYQDFNAEKG